MNTHWKYIKPLKEEGVIEKFETLHNIKLPDDLKDVIKKYNGGRPEWKLYDTEKENDKVFKTLLSFNREDIENIYTYCDIDTTIKGMIPFASDPAGNLFVLKDGKIFLWDHELDAVTFLADSFTEFLNKLHK